MRCFWPNTARTAFRAFNHRPSSPDSTLHTWRTSHTSSAQKKPADDLLTSRHIWSASPLSQAAYDLRTRSNKPVDVTPVSPLSDPRLTTAQVSRAACQAIHHALRKPIGGREEAYLLVNSLRYSMIKDDPIAKQRTSFIDFQKVAINFGRPISPRLSSHALLHDLIRIGRKREATDLAVLMMETGLKLRSKTLEAFVNTLAPDPTAKPRTLVPPPTFTPNHLTLADLLPMAQSQRTRFALQLFAVARKTHHQRTSGMFGTLLCICLINGEIILASLIFGFVVKDWQLKKALMNRFDTSETKLIDLPEVQLHYHFKRERLVPTRSNMTSILKTIDHTLAQNGEGEEFDLTLTSALQALANLAVLLDHRQLPFGSISSLVRSIYKCPKIDAEVWVVDEHGQPKLVQAYSYLHDVLERLLVNLPSKQRKRSLPEGYRLVPPRLRETVLLPVLPELDLHACNALLHYSLRHRLSPSRADLILTHMSKERKPSLKPDIETLNILLRSGTLLRESDIAQQAISALRTVHSSINEVNATSDSATPMPTSEATQVMHTAKWICQQVQRQPQPTTRDIYTLITHIMHATSIGCPRQIGDLVFEIFPELRVVIGSTCSSVSADDVLAQKKARSKMVDRAVAYGPYMFTVLLNSLLKAGKTGLAKSVWNLAQRAEQRSWQSPKPWILPIHAYTSMLRCFVLEYDKPYLNPRNNRTEAAFQEARKKTLVDGHHLYRSVKLKVKDALVILRRNKTCSKLDGVEFPQPDPLFYNAALELFILPKVRARSELQHHTKDYLKYQFSLAKLRNIEYGEVSKLWNPLFQEVGEDMVQAGFAIPPALRHIFIGRWYEGTWNFDLPSTPSRAPLAFPDGQPSFSPFCIPTKRERGLPHRRRRRPLRKT